MPAQWPLFINNVSSKLASRSSKGADDFGTFVANEYFNAVKTAQTPFGNLHSSGQKTILEIGFKKAFNDLFKSLAPTLEDKIKDGNYADLLEGLPIPKKYDAAAEFRKWVVSKGDKLPDTNFYEFFPPKPEPAKPIGTPPELTSADIFGAAIEKDQPILTFTGKSGVAPYIFTYTLNDGEPVQLTSDEFGFVKMYVPSDVPGKLKYTLINVVDSAFPDTICKVVYQGIHTADGFPKRDRCQFSWYCDGKSDRIPESEAWEQAKLVAWNMLHTDLYRGLAEGATHYHATYVDPYWAASNDMVEVGQIGKHIFYRYERS